MSPHNKDLLLLFWSYSLAFIAGSITLFVFSYLILESIPAVTNIGVSRFFFDRGWHPEPFEEDGSYNIIPLLVGTLFTTAIAILFAAPLGICSALFCRFYAPPWIDRNYRKIIELLAGVPSVVYGFWGLVVLVPIINEIHPPGASFLAGTIILTLMILPTVCLTSEAAFRNVPETYVQNAHALGISRAGTVLGLILPSSRPEVFTGILLATTRAIGETMAVLLVCGNVVQIPKSIFDPVRTLTSNMALEMAYAYGDHRSALFFTGLVLSLLVTILVALVFLIEKHKTSKAL